jgi:hypothetical protein
MKPERRAEIEKSLGNNDSYDGPLMSMYLCEELEELDRLKKQVAQLEQAWMDKTRSLRKENVNE